MVWIETVVWIEIALGTSRNAVETGSRSFG
jgi:hypothetical protein